MSIISSALCRVLRFKYRNTRRDRLAVRRQNRSDPVMLYTETACVLQV